MRQLKTRTYFVLFFALLLGIGMVVLVIFYVRDGASWAAYRANSHVYENGSLTSGAIRDRNGVLLYDCASGRYNDDWELRTATVHAVGDRNGSIAAGAKTLFSDELVGFSVVSGTNGTGREVQLTIDAELNRTAYQAMDGRKGVVALYNYQTGEILCMLSLPAFDPEDSDMIAAVNSGEEQYEGAYLNRFYSGRYPPGSTFKLVTAAAAMETLGGMDRYTYDCDGSLDYDGGSVTCPSAHGELTFSTALSESCNGAFAELANRVGGKTLERYARLAGLLDSHTVGGVTTAKGSFSTTVSALDEGWSGVGQYEDLVNPCAELMLMGCIASGGTAAAPHLLHGVSGGLGVPSVEAGEKSSIGWKPETCARLKMMMRDDVTEEYGQEQFGTLAVCAKSGTAEVGGGAPHAWFTGFVDDEAYPYAFTVVIENGGWGASQAGAVAARVLEAACEPEEGTLRGLEDLE